jgi:hypothetical protein
LRRCAINPTQEQLNKIEASFTALEDEFLTYGEIRDSTFKELGLESQDPNEAYHSSVDKYTVNRHRAVWITSEAQRAKRLQKIITLRAEKEKTKQNKEMRAEKKRQRDEEKLATSLFINNSSSSSTSTSSSSSSILSSEGEHTATSTNESAVSTTAEGEQPPKKTKRQTISYKAMFLEMVNAAGIAPSAATSKDALLEALQHKYQSNNPQPDTTSSATSSSATNTTSVAQTTADKSTDEDDQKQTTKKQKKGKAAPVKAMTAQKSSSSSTKSSAAALVNPKNPTGVKKSTKASTTIKKK